MGEEPASWPPGVWGSPLGSQNAGGEGVWAPMDLDVGSGIPLVPLASSWTGLPWVNEVNNYKGLQILKAGILREKTMSDKLQGSKG